MPYYPNQPTNQPHERYSGGRYRRSSVRQEKFPAGKASRTPQGSREFWSSRLSYLFETCSNTVTPAQQQQQRQRQRQLSTKCSLLPMRAVPRSSSSPRSTALEEPARRRFSVTSNNNGAIVDRCDQHHQPEVFEGAINVATRAIPSSSPSRVLMSSI